MKVVTNLQWPESPFRRPDRLFGRDRRQIVAFDAEWTKNYRITNGSRPFCYSFVTFVLPNARLSLADLATFYGFKSVYVDSPDDEQELIARADRDLLSAIEGDHLVVGHQVTSDLGVLKAASKAPVPGIDAVLERWHSRADSPQASVFDTRYDIDGLVSGRSRRLVDVCEELDLDVCQPEINGSMTKVHREFVEHGRELNREKLMVMNLRHSLSTCIVALLALEAVERAPLDVNAVLVGELWDQLDYVSSGMLTRLLASQAAAT